MDTLEALLEAIEREARRAEFPIDLDVYRQAARNHARPILVAGSMAAPVCVVGRDLGAEEVALGEPLVGAAGRLVRSGLYQGLIGVPPLPANRRMAEVLEHVLLTNTVPYKPPGNKAYTSQVKERFRPFLAALLAGHWAGGRVMTLGTEAFHWFAPYAAAGEAQALWDRPDRYDADLRCVLTLERESAPALRKEVIVSPLPHPSPLNARWYKKFPELLARRLEAVRAETGSRSADQA
jgi:uracil-DNA glycosylase family 4